MDGRIFIVKDSRFDAIFFVQPTGSLAVFDGSQHAQAFIDNFPNKKDVPFMQIREGTLACEEREQCLKTERR